MTMLLYTNGDSFTAGSELGDEIIPGWPGYLRDCDADNPQVKKNVAWLKHVRRSEEYTEIREKADALGRDLAWPRHLANLLNCNHVNNAMGGSSMDRICRTTICDLINLKNKHKNIVAVISTTDIFRSEIADPNHPELWEPFDAKTIPDKDTPNYEIYKSLIKYKVMHETLFYKLWNFYWNILQVKNFCAINNIKLFWLEVFPECSYPDAEERQHPMLASMIKEVDLSFLMTMSIVAQTYPNPEKYCAGGHFRKEIHEIFARHLYKRLKNKI